MLDGYDVTLLDTRGVLWSLTEGSPGREGVVLMGPPDLQSDVKVRSRSTVRQIGGDSTGWIVDPMSGSLPLAIPPWIDDDFEVWSALLHGVSHFEDAVLSVSTPRWGELSAPVRVDGNKPMPKRSPTSVGRDPLEFDIPVISYQGCWIGDVESGSSFSWENRGDLPARGVVRWSGNSAAFTLSVNGAAAIASGTLPAPPSGTVAELDLDPAVASQVTVGGDVSQTLWRAMRARIWPDIPPGAVVRVDCVGGAVAEFGGRFTNPWRWN